MSFLLPASFPLMCEVQEARSYFLLARSLCCAWRDVFINQAHLAPVLGILFDSVHLMI
jgi:hypothetical protein